ncbi:hypothetical protein Cni_G28926 [Canna indica]|uniref:RNase H type-1 domain-containing protein n=1 Tax=Canna indica TaxID=4628 RepID=A0AAQ3L4A2_9LILI|nr:hypothetical protein Cni_G28926 [Canna indica]
MDYMKQAKSKSRDVNMIVTNLNEELEGNFTVCCDAAWCKNRDVGYGFIVLDRNNDRIFCSGCKDRAESPLMAETLAIWYGLDNARKKGMKQLTVRSYCLRIVRILREEFQAPWKISMLVNKIKKLADIVEVVKWQFCSREINTLAHDCARKGIGLNLYRFVSCIERESDVNREFFVTDYCNEEDCIKQLNLNKRGVQREYSPAMARGEGRKIKDSLLPLPLL